MSHTGSKPWIQFTAALMLAAGLAACSVKTTVSVSSATPAQVQHLYVTVIAVWLNTDATAAPGGSGWIGRTLTSPQTIDLATLSNGTLSALVSGVDTPPGTYRQLRLELADSSAALTSAASSAGLSWNAQVQYLDSAGGSVTLPLELPSPASQLIVPVSVAIQGAGARPIFAGSMAAGSQNTGTSAGVAVDIQALRNWVLFDYGGQTGALLSPQITAYDIAKAGGITGTLDVSAAAAGVLTGAQGIVATAETLSADGSRYQPVKSVSVSSSGEFTLYPLPVSDGAGDSLYEVVVHGPGIRSVIISQVPVSAGEASASTRLQSSALQLTAAKSFSVNTAANSATLPGGSRVGFYQTVPGFTAPHLIEYAMPDPFNAGFTADVSLSADVIDHGLYANGGAVSLSSSAPAEGVGTYRIGADAPLRSASSLSNTISAPTLPASGVQPIFLPAPGAPQGGASLRINGTLTFARPGRFDRGFVLISRGGLLINAADLSASLSGPGATASFSLGSLPAGAAGSRYDVAVRLWNSRDPSGTLTRAAASSTLDAAGGGVQSIGITVP